MKFLLIAIYLTHGGVKPELRTATVDDKLTCQRMASAYMEKAIHGQKRAFCLQLKTGGG